MKTNLKNIVQVILTYMVIYLICSVIFIALFHTPLFESVEVLMYRGIIFLIITGILSAILMYLAGKLIFKKKSFIDIKDVLLMFCGFCCVNMVLFTLIPVTVERSVSVFMLSYMEESNGKAFTQEEIKEAFVDIYVEEFEAFDKRFKEQLVTGSIEEKDNDIYELTRGYKSEQSYVLTKNGERIVKMFRMVAKWFNTDDRCVYPITYNK